MYHVTIGYYVEYPAAKLTIYIVLCTRFKTLESRYLRINNKVILYDTLSGKLIGCYGPDIIDIKNKI